MTDPLSSPVSSKPDLEGLLQNHPAPLRIAERYTVHATRERIFSLLGDLQSITRFFPMIHHAEVRHEEGCAGEGSIRVCSVRGMGKIRERIVWWSEPAGYAYTAAGELVPIRDHLGVIRIFENDEGSATIEWRQYFNTRYGLLGWMFPFMMKIMMGRAIRNIGRLLEG